MWHLRPLTGRAATRQQSAVLIWLILPIGRQIETKRKARDRILSSMPHLYMLLFYIIIYISWLLTQSLILNHNETTLIFIYTDLIPTSPPREILNMICDNFDSLFICPRRSCLFSSSIRTIYRDNTRTHI